MIFTVSLWLSFLLGTLSVTHLDIYSTRRDQRCDCDTTPHATNKIASVQYTSTAFIGENNPHTPSDTSKISSDYNYDSTQSSETLTTTEHEVLLRKIPDRPKHDDTVLHKRGPSRFPVAADTHNSSLHIKSYHLTWTKIQETRTTVFSAYYDERPAMYGPSIVILGYQWKGFRNSSLHCVFKYSNKRTQCSDESSVVVEMDACNNQKEFDKKKERQYLHLFHICRLREDQEIPVYVALSHNHSCMPHSAMIPIYNYRPKVKAEYGVCVETPAFKKTAKDFVSFIEMNRILGAELFTLYISDIDPQTQSFLRKTYGGPNGILDMIQWTKELKEKEPIHYYGEILAIHDCLYRNMHRVKYLMFVDLDEVIVPRRYFNWQDMMAEIDHPYVDSFIFVNAVFMKTPNMDQLEQSKDWLSWRSQLCSIIPLPDYLNSFNRVNCRFHYYMRSKMIVKPTEMVDIDIHGVCTRAGNTTHYFVLDDNVVSQHYRKIPTIECRKNRKTRKYESTHDEWITRYATPLLKAMNEHLCRSPYSNIILPLYKNQSHWSHQGG